MGISRQSRTELARELVKLSIDFAFRRIRRGVFLEDVLTRQTPVYRLLGRWDGVHHPASGAPDAQWSEWATILRRKGPGAATEQAALDLLGKELDAGIERDLNLWPWTPDTYGRTPTGTGTYGFFLYEMGTGGEGRGDLILHMGNALAPESPFTDPRARVRELLAVIADARSRQPGLVSLSCGSWLNSHPAFNRFFPPGWPPGGHPMPVGIYFDWWGQFVSRTGGFHARNGLHLRQTGEFPFPSIRCRCSLAELEGHLRHIRDSARHGVPFA